ncbi:MAG: hypothetical protein H6Q17_1073 [Bacteroidetes bacterium]|nr:hypothetical protein [Bacteroidota bacterium]
MLSIGGLITIPFSIGFYLHYTSNKTNNNITINNQETKITTISSRKRAKSKHRGNSTEFTAGNITNSTVVVGNSYETNSTSTHKEAQSVPSNLQSDNGME